MFALYIFYSIIFFLNKLKNIKSKKDNSQSLNPPLISHRDFPLFEIKKQKEFFFLSFFDGVVDLGLFKKKELKILILCILHLDEKFYKYECLRHGNNNNNNVSSNYCTDDYGGRVSRFESCKSSWFVCFFYLKKILILKKEPNIDQTLT